MRLRSSLLAACLAIVAVAACKKDHPAAGNGSAAGGSASGSAAPASPGGSDGGAGAEATIPAAPVAMLPRPYLWQVERDGKTSFLFGTMHLGVDSEKELPPWVWTRFGEAKTFAMEADASDTGMIASVLRSDGTSLDKELGAETWAKLEAVVGKSMAGNLKGFKPSAVAVLVSVQGLPMTAPMDLVFLQKAKQGAKAVIYLEDVHLQQQLVDKWMDARALKAMLDDMDGVKKQNVEVLSAYRAGDDKRLVTAIDDPSQWKDMGLTEADAGRAMDEMLYGRNRAWISPLEKLLAAGNAFVAVGVGHLVGDKSVIDLLGQKGYRITRVTGP